MIALATNSVTATVPVPVEPTGLAVSADGARTFVASQPTGTITVINNATNEVQAKGEVAGNVRDVVVTPDGPKGPAQVAKMGVIQLARASGLPIVPLAFGCSKKNTSRVGIDSWSPFLGLAASFCGGRRSMCLGN